MVEVRAARKSYPWYTGLLVGVIAYVLYLILCYALTGHILNFLDVHFPFKFFYHLQEGEAYGPIGDPMLLVTGIWIQIIMFWLTFAPVALFLGTSRAALISLTFLNELLLLFIIPSIIRTLFGYH